ncbi:hypothetical protein F2Q69_00051328 [Brassica cretica]|uniref:Prolamin-like domain-containing protein n=1 Tax=Brassica cretica TaxID=69181 RepID=A0A8S9Q2D9_BRACR|nr:hypothetical protein F2Q69_00051328 [Brassica cretica]
MNKKPSNLMFFLSALIFTALVFQQSEVAAKANYCSAIDTVPGCHDSLKLAAENDFRWLGKDCCKVVYAISYPCFLDVLHGRNLDINFFKSICVNVIGPITFV